jgi:hypothetical protein
VQLIRHALLLSLASACSLGITGPSPDRPRREVPKCDSGKGLVALDGLVGTSLAFAGIAVMGGGDTGPGAALALAGGAFLLSAVHGNGNANACREEMVKFTLETSPQFDDETSRIARQAGPPGMRPPLPATFHPTKVAPPAARREAAARREQAVPQEPLEQEPAEQTTAQQTTVQQTTAEQTTAQQPPSPTKPPAPAKPPAKQAPAPKQTDDWHDFWQEVP